MYGFHSVLFFENFLIAGCSLEIADSRALVENKRISRFGIFTGLRNRFCPRRKEKGCRNKIPTVTSFFLLVINDVSSFLERDITGWLAEKSVVCHDATSRHPLRNLPKKTIRWPLEWFYRRPSSMKLPDGSKVWSQMASTFRQTHTASQNLIGESTIFLLLGHSFPPKSRLSVSVDKFLLILIWSSRSSFPFESSTSWNRTRGQILSSNEHTETVKRRDRGDRGCNGDRLARINIFVR